MAWRVGVDEAGRGPVLGSMFVAAVAAEDGTSLPDGIVDSKRLSSDRRELLAKKLAERDDVRSAVVEVSAEAIDGRSLNLNRQTARAQARSIQQIHETVGPIGGCMIDACDVDADRFADHVRRELVDVIPLEATHRAEDIEPLVAAASIVAKSYREQHVASLADRFGPVGSGYPSDPTTRQFLRSYVESHRDLPACARRSWRTCADVLEAAEQGTLDEF